MHHRQQASRAGGQDHSAAGVNRLTPVIRPMDSVSTPPSPVNSGIVGLFIPVSSAITFFIELNPESGQRSRAAGMMHLFPKSATGDISK
jgi:hypothetical protein